MEVEKGGRNLFGDFVKNRRKELRLTLRSFCLEAEFDPGNFSKIERGILPPPKDQETLKKWAKVLEIAEEPAIGQGRIPEDVISDSELAQSLPLIFRTIRGDKITDEQFEKLKKLIRDAISGQ
jgi:transcriptional regulator with XRE-family HTH domain